MAYILGTPSKMNIVSIKYHYTDRICCCCSSSSSFFVIVAKLQPSYEYLKCGECHREKKKQYVHLTAYIFNDVTDENTMHLRLTMGANTHRPKPNDESETQRMSEMNTKKKQEGLQV